MTDSYTQEGIKKLHFVAGPNEFVRGATWVRSLSQINVPVNDVPVYIAQNCEIVTAIILTRGGPGSCTIGIWRTPFAMYPPDSSDSIVGGSPPTISNDETYADSTLSGWSKNLALGDTLLFHLVSSNVFNEISIFLVLREI